MWRDSLSFLCSKPNAENLELTSYPAHLLWAALVPAFTGLLLSWEVSKYLFTKNKDFYPASQTHSHISKHKSKKGTSNWVIKKFKVGGKKTEMAENRVECVFVAFVLFSYSF